jgi:hypothetical protein
VPPSGSPDSSPQLPGSNEDSPEIPFLSFDNDDQFRLTEYELQSDLQGSFFTLYLPEVLAFLTLT